MLNLWSIFNLKVSELVSKEVGNFTIVAFFMFIHSEEMCFWWHFCAVQLNESTFFLTVFLKNLGLL